MPHYHSLPGEESVDHRYRQVREGGGGETELGSYQKKAASWPRLGRTILYKKKRCSSEDDIYRTVGLRPLNHLISSRWKQEEKKKYENFVLLHRGGKASGSSCESRRGGKAIRGGSLLFPCGREDVGEQKAAFDAPRSRAKLLQKEGGNFVSDSVPYLGKKTESGYRRGFPSNP